MAVTVSVHERQMRAVLLAASQRDQHDIVALQILLDIGKGQVGQAVRDRSVVNSHTSPHSTAVAIALAGHYQTVWPCQRQIFGGGHVGAGRAVGMVRHVHAADTRIEVGAERREQPLVGRGIVQLAARDVGDGEAAVRHDHADRTRGSVQLGRQVVADRLHLVAGQPHQRELGIMMVAWPIRQVGRDGLARSMHAEVEARDHDNLR